MRPLTPPLELVARTRGIALLAALWMCLPLVAAAPAGAAAPTHDDFDHAERVSALPYSHQVDTSEATAAADDPDGCGTTGATVWYVLEAPADGVVIADTFGSTFDTTLAAYQGVRGALTELVCNDDNLGASMQSYIQIDVVAGGTYYIMSGSPTGQGGALWLELDFAVRAPNDDVAEATEIDATPFVDQSGRVLATAAPDDPATCRSGSGSVWYAIAPPQDGLLEAWLFPSGFGGALAVYRGGPGEWDELSCEDSTIGARAVVPVEAGTRYLVKVAGLFWGTGYPYRLHVDLRPPTQPLLLDGPHRVVVTVDDVDSVHPLDLRLRQPVAADICADCAIGDSADLGVLDGELVFELHDRHCFGTITRTSAQATVTQLTDTRWTLTFDAGGPTCSVNREQGGLVATIEATPIPIVTTTANDGPGSLRQALLDANADPDHTTIVVDDGLLTQPGGAVFTPTSPLPIVTSPLDLRGALPGATGPAVLDASGQGFGHGFALAAQTTLSGWEVRGAPLQAISIGQAAAGSTITDSVLRDSHQGVVVNAAEVTLVGNVVIGNELIGVNLGPDATDARLQGNLIGTDAAGTEGLGNGFGIVTAAPDGLIGAPDLTHPDAQAQMNTIAGNRLDGLRALTGAVGVRAAGNLYGRTGAGQVLANDARAINLVPPDEEQQFRSTPNDELARDVDSGPNGLQNYPTLQIDRANRAAVLLVSRPATTYTIDLFATPSCDDNGYGESGAVVHSATVTTDGNGVALHSASMVGVPPGNLLTATATGPEGTSEFSRCIRLG